MKLVRLLLGIVFAPFVKGSSIVAREGNYAIKVAKPRFVVRIIYLFIRGRWKSPYESKEGMLRAMYLRRIANHITSADERIGRPVFAKAHSIIAARGGKTALVLEWIDGNPVTKYEAQGFLQTLEQVLFDAGLPTWSISLKNPTAHGDLRVKGGQIWCLDYESVLPNIFALVPSRHLDPIDLHLLLKRANCLKNYSGYQKLQDAIAELIDLNGGID